MNINPLQSFWGFDFKGPTLPAFYSEYTSQEARLHQICKIINRSVHWNDEALDKINELVDAVNTANIPDTSALVKDVQALKASYEAQKTELATLNTDVTKLVARVDTLEKVGEIDSILRRLNAVEANINSLTSTQIALSAKVDSLQAELNTVKSDVVLLTENVNNTSAVLSNTNAMVNSIGAKTEELDTNIKNSVEDIKTIQDEVEITSNDIIEINAKLENLAPESVNERIDQLETATETNTEEITGLKTRVDTLEENGSGGESTVEIEEIKSGLSAVTTNVSNLTTSVESNTSSIANINEKITTLEGNSTSSTKSIPFYDQWWTHLNGSPASMDITGPDFSYGGYTWSPGVKNKPFCMTAPALYNFSNMLRSNNVSQFRVLNEDEGDEYYEYKDDFSNNKPYFFPVFDGTAANYPILVERNPFTKSFADLSYILHLNVFNNQDLEHNIVTTKIVNTGISISLKKIVGAGAGITNYRILDVASIIIKSGNEYLNEKSIKWGSVDNVSPSLCYLGGDIGKPLSNPTIEQLDLRVIAIADPDRAQW